MQPCASAVSMQPKRAIAVRYAVLPTASYSLCFICGCFLLGLGLYCLMKMKVSLAASILVFRILRYHLMRLDKFLYRYGQLTFFIPLQEYSLLKNLPNSHFPIYISVNFSLTSADT